MNGLGILQGRLSPAPVGRAQRFPAGRWQDEFPLARTLGFTAIEWLITAADMDANPIWSDRGALAVRQTSRDAGIAVCSLCADFLIERPDWSNRLEQVVQRASQAGAGVVLVPVLEGNALRDRAHATAFLAGIAPAIHAAERAGIVVALESDWPGDRLAELLFDAKTPALAAYCDVGNAAADGRDPAADVHSLGSWVAGVHIKDRSRGGPSVSIGKGSVDFARVFAALDAIGFGGTPILETPVGGDAIASARDNLAALQSAIALGAR